MTSSAAPRACWAVTTPGLELVAASELRAIGLTPRETEAGGVAFDADAAGLFAANLHLRTASRVLVRIAEFRATAFYELERQARAIRWAELVPAGSPVELRVTCKKSRLYHSDGVAERVFAAIARAVPGVAEASVTADDDEGGEPATSQLFVVRFVRDVCTISVDSSGALLHRRGYRLTTAKAPIRETLAAAMLLALGYDGTGPLLDPMCGSGTIAIEAALIARRMAPGLARPFACERWPGAPIERFADLRRAAEGAARPRAGAPISASDRDAGAVRATEANAARAGVAADLQIRQCPLSAIEPGDPPGLLVVNPPYGGRIGEADTLRDLYAQLGNVARAQCAGWTLAMLSADRTLEAQVKLRFTETLRFKNGGIPVRLVRASVPDGKAGAPRQNSP
jgi:putative N6-adenine-specific DNA methylase